MKKIIPFLISTLLILNCNAHIASDPCSFKFVLSDPYGFGWYPYDGIKITVDGIDYGFLNLAWGSSYVEKIILLPSGEMQLFWIGSFSLNYHFEIYDSSDELIYTSPEDMNGGLFFTYQIDCLSNMECLPIKDFEWRYIEEEKQVNLSWTAPESVELIGFDIYRNDSLIAHITPTITSYSDNTANLENGNYKYCVIPVYPFECDLEVECLEVPIYVGIKNYENNITIYPNPVSNVVNIIGTDIANVKVFFFFLQLILNKHNSNTINVSELQNGIYILSIETTTKQITRKKLIINH
jgi:hypothetical protein